MKLQTTILALLISSFIWSELYLSQRNVIATNDTWELHQLRYLNPNIVSLPIYLSPVALNNYELQSNLNLGIIRLFTKSQYEIESIDAYLTLKENGYVDIITEVTDAGHTAIRLSKNELFPSAFIRFKKNGEYQSHSPLKLNLPTGFQKVSLKNGEIHYGNERVLIEGLKLSTGKFGLEVSPTDSSVQWIWLKTKDGHKWLNFLPTEARAPLYLKFLLVFICLNFTLGLIPALDRKKIPLFFLGLGIIAFVYDFKIGLPSKINPEDIDAKLIAPLKNHPSKDILFFCSEGSCKETLIKNLPEKKGKRLLIFGGSQSKYGLVDDYSESFHFRLYDSLRKQSPDIELYNLSSPGQFQDRVRAYESGVKRTDPDILIIETLAMKNEEEAIRKFIQEFKTFGKKVILLRTPQNLLNYGNDGARIAVPELLKGMEAKLNNVPDDMVWLAFNNVEFIKSLVKENSLYYIDSNEMIIPAQLNQQGQIFWDMTHLTSYGQGIYAEWLAKKIISDVF